MVRKALLVSAAIAIAIATLFAAGYGIKPGRYVGTWTGQSADGKIDIRLTGDDKQAKEAAVTFTYQGADIPTRLREFKTTGGSIEITYEFELEGMPLVSALKGALEDGDKLVGTYRTTNREGSAEVDSGKWYAKR